MAELSEGQALALSSRPNPSKSVVYVKLTDSALKSLEEFARQKGSDTNGGGPTIQFRNSGGVIVVPKAAGGNGKDKVERFGFSISNLEDGGSFQCLKSTCQGSLESMGAMRETIRVKANDDVFQRTIQRQHEAKKASEKKTTVLLDDKNKKKVSLPRSGIVKKTTPTVIPPTQNRHSISALSNSGPSFSGPGRGPTPGSSRPTGPRPPSPDHSHAPFSRQAELKKCHPSKSPPNPEIIKRPIRERLIHLLAVKPYKKIELFPRLKKDGLKEKDKKSWSTALREVTELKNNCYELKRSVWNDVSEDWPFYTESDRAALRRRKPQNLTPPVSDTGSTSSGHSPSSTNPASPPQITLNPSLKRRGYYETNNEAPKKKRVSHFKRTEPMPSSSGGFSRSPYGMSGSSPMVCSGSTSVSPRFGSGGSGTGGASGIGSGVGISSSGHSHHHSHHHHHDHTLSSPKQQDIDRLDLLSNSAATFEDESAPDWAQFPDNDQPPPQPAAPPPLPPQQQQPSPMSHSSLAQISPARKSNTSPASTTTVHQQQQRASPVAMGSSGQQDHHHHRLVNNSPSKRPALRNNSPSTRGSWATPSDVGDNNTANAASSSPQLIQFHCHNANKDFETEFVPITNLQQRARYKEEFNSHYNQYIQFHTILGQVQAKFTQLENSLKDAEKGSQEYMRIKSEILSEYEPYRMDQSYQDARHNFHYLHEKLAFLKRLVHDYDTSAAAGSGHHNRNHHHHPSDRENVAP